MNALIRYDRRVSLWFQGWPAALQPFMLTITHLGSVWFVVSLSSLIALTMLIKGQSRYMWAFAAVIPGEMLNAVVKLLFNRVRPETEFAQNMILHTKSFPSGHAFGSMLLYGLLAYLALTHLPHGWNWLAAGSLSLLIVCIGISRVYLGAHYFLDVIGGWIFGAIVLVLVIKLAKL